MKQENELSIMIKSRKLIEYIFTITEKSSKKFRFTITSKLQNVSLSIMEYLIRANEIYIKDKTHTFRGEEHMMDLSLIGGEFIA